MIYQYLNKSYDIALDMYRIALFCEEHRGFVMYCIQNKPYNIRGILKLTATAGNTNFLSEIITVFTYFIKVVRKCADNL